MIRLSMAQAEAICDAAERTYPEECCGLLVGPAGTPEALSVSRVVPSANVCEGDRRQGFEIDPRLLLELHRELREGAEAMIGVYHSHPNGSGAPSETDLARAWDPDLVWIIAAVREGGSASLAAFRPLPAKLRFEPVTLRIVDGEP